MGDSNWLHADSLGSIADTFLNTSTIMGTCRFPPYTVGVMALEQFDSWMFINECVARRGWSFRDSATESALASPSVLPFRALVQRNHSRSYRRRLRARSLSLQTGCDLWEDERHLAEPSDGEEIPAALPGVHLDLPGHFSLPLASLEPRLTVQSVKRPGDALDMGSNEEQRTEKDPEESDLDAGAMDVGTYLGEGPPATWHTPSRLWIQLYMASPC